MKTTFIRFIGLSLSALLIGLHPFAQKTGSNKEPTQEISYNVNKKISPSVVNSSPLNLPPSVPFNAKVFKQFNKIFPDANNVKWSFATNGNYHACFIKDGASNSILFDKNGKIIYLINYFSEKQLPSDVKTIVEDNYDEFKISDVARILENNRTIWIISLTGVNHWIEVAVEGGEIQEIEKFKWAN